MWVWIELPLGLVGQSWYPKTLLIIVERVSSQSFTLPDSFSVITLFFQVWFSINNFTKFPRCRSLKEKENTNKWIHGNKGEENGKWMNGHILRNSLSFLASSNLLHITRTLTLSVVYNAFKRKIHLKRHLFLCTLVRHLSHAMVSLPKIKLYIYRNKL